MRKFALLFAVIVSISIVANAQFNYAPEMCLNFKGTYTDLGSNGSAVSTSNHDDANSAVQSIGFNFNFNGTNYTHFILNTNGFIKLGTNASMTPPSATNLAYTNFDISTQGGVFNSTNANDVNILAVFNHDLDSSAITQTEYRVHTTGSSPDRVCTIQFKNVRDKNITSSTGSPMPHVQFEEMNFQIKLYESGGVVDYIYGLFIPTTDSSIAKVASIGIRGGLNDFVTVVKSSSQGYSVNTFEPQNNSTLTAVPDGFYFGNDNLAKAVPVNVIRPLPDVGRTFRFIPKTSNDAAIKNIYTYHAQTIPWGLPHQVSARVENVGTNTKNSTKVYLKVSGANTYLDSTNVGSLGSGVSSTVNFNGYHPDNLGTDLIEMWISSDAHDHNNHLSWNQQVSNQEIGYGDSSEVWYNFGFNTGGIFCNRYNVSGKRRVSTVRVQIGFSTTNIGQSVFGVVLDSYGNIVGQSDNHVISLSDLGKYLDFEITKAYPSNNDIIPPLVSNGDFYAGIGQPGGGYFPLSLQMESTNRVGAFFSHILGNSSTFTDIHNHTSPVVQSCRQAINAKLVGSSIKIDSVTGLSEPSCALSNQSVYVHISNVDSIATDFSIDTLHLEVSSTGAQVQKFTRLINQGILESDSSASYLITSAFDLSIAGKYNITVEARQRIEVDTTNNYKNLTINVVDTPDVNLKVLPKNLVCFGDPFSFEAIPYTAGSAMYQWKVNGNNIGGATTSNTFTNPLNWGDSVWVDLITDHCSTSTYTVTSNPVRIYINPKPKQISGIAGTDTVIENTKKSYGLALNPGSIYTWSVVGGTLSDTTGLTQSVTWGGPNTNASLTIHEVDSINCEIDHVLPVVIISIIGIENVHKVGIGIAYPNPADHSVRIPIYTENSSSRIRLDLFDITGQNIMKIYEGEIGRNNEIIVHTANLKDGLYFYRLQTSDGQELVKKLVVRHP